ncbi:uncharacterized protein LOC100249234 isoform X1 [Vitis vinifera]|nr:uncharacterized protein LOC100249234 isoform X1 [Vitis vinifera]XP_010657990.1 uncharacterized protein LOC100249234 isoform X1 [Vitis vinifera]XP_059597309.1 uncharacterized protein LOC100249234 isoform X1 [Vitis vinifera]|eukprot:XP_002263486.2 PREDICTED: uncharacterized protein LOC100249234 isoform X1 [Vitis vinifera]
MKRKRVLKKANPANAPSMGAIVNQTTDAASEDQRTNYEEQPIPSDPDPRHNEEEFNVALMVIKKIMSMDGTAPFNVPVNPIVLGVTDYFDVIGTPMDFGTILCNLENGVKYMNSEDVFNDARCIWENCYRYNKPGDRILELVKQVKENFMMLWTAAGLYSAEPRTESGDMPLLPSKDSGMQQIRCSPRCQMGSIASSQQDQSCHSQAQANTKPQSCKRLNLAEPSSSESHQLHPSSNETQSSHSQTGAATNSLRDTLNLSPRDTGKQSSRCLHGLPEGPMTNNQQDQLGSIQPHLQQAFQSSSFEHPNSDFPHQLQSSQSSSSEYQPFHSQSDQESDGSGPSSRRRETPGQGSSITKRKPRVRGPTLCLDVWNMPEGQHVVVETNEVGQPDGDSACKLGNFLGTIARDGHLAPLTYADWRAVPQAAKDNMLQLAKSKFEISPRVENWVLKTLGKRWKDWKAQLKAKYFNNKTDDEHIEIDDERVLPEQRPILLAYWRSEESQKRSAMNKANRAKQSIGHTAGTKSFARIRKEERNKRPDGDEPTRAELFIVTHLRKDGTPVDETSANIITQLQERAQANPQPASHERVLHDDIFSQVMGKDGHGRVRTYGLGPCPSDIWGPRPSRAEAIAIASEAKKALNEVAKIKEKMEAVESKCAEMEVQMAEMKSALQKSPV